MAGTVTYEVRVFRGGSTWSTESQWDQIGQAKDHARAVLSTLRYQGVRVIESQMDEKTGKFRERTLLNRYKHQGNTQERNWPSRFSASRAFAEVRREAPALTNAAVLCFGILVLAIVGFFVAGGRLSQFSPDLNAGRITYDLPSITATLNGGSTPMAVRLSLSLELRDKTDIPTVKRSLSQIVNAVIDGLETVPAEKFAAKEQIEEIRADLQSRIQSAARDARIEDVAVKKFQPF